VGGQSAFVDLHRSQSSGMAADLMNNGEIRLNTWGTDIDVRHCLGKDLTHPSQILKRGKYILPPVSLTQAINASPTVALTNLLDEAFAALEKNRIDGDVYVCVPVNCGNSHWCLAEFEINRESKIQWANLWDPLGGDASIKKTSPAFQNFTQVVADFDHEHDEKLTPELELAGIQHNGHSCMDYVLQKAYQQIGKNNAIVAANNNSSVLRLEVVKQIVVNHPQFDSEMAANLQINDSRIIVGERAEQAHSMPLDARSETAYEEFLDQFTTEEKSRALTQEDKDLQIMFDETFARRLQELYKQNSARNIDESRLVAEARRLAMRDLGLFSEVRKKPASPLEENNKPKFRSS
jgi:hypothetical protein